MSILAPSKEKNRHILMMEIRSMREFGWLTLSNEKEYPILYHSSLLLGISHYNYKCTFNARVWKPPRVIYINQGSSLYKIEEQTIL